MSIPTAAELFTDALLPKHRAIIYEAMQMSIQQANEVLHFISKERYPHWVEVAEWQKANCNQLVEILFSNIPPAELHAFSYAKKEIVFLNKDING